MHALQSSRVLSPDTNGGPNEQAHTPVSSCICIFSAVYSQTRYVTVIVVKANLRGSPSASGALIGEVRSGEKFSLLEERGSWYLVETPSYVGWLHGNTIEFSSGPSKSRSVPNNSRAAPVGVISPDNQRLRVPDPESVKPEMLDVSGDQGYDVVIANYDDIYLRENPPDTVSLGDPLPSPVKQLKRGDQMVLLGRTKTRNWINVIDLSSGEEGWVYVSHVKIYYTRNPKTSLPNFQERRTYSDRSPELNVTNKTNRTLNLRLGTQRYTIEPFGSKTITVAAGSYNFYASVPRAYPLMGEKYWSDGVIYSWTFFIDSK